MKVDQHREFNARSRTYSVYEAGCEPDELAFHDALIAGAAFAADPARAGGMVVHAVAGPHREAWLQYVLSLLPIGSPVRRIPVHINDERLLGGLDLAATLAAGRPVAGRGLLQETDGGVIVIPSAERLTSSLASRIATAMDLGAVALQRDGFDESSPTRFGVIAFDEGQSAEERPPSVLLDRAALHITLPHVKIEKIAIDRFTRERVAEAAKETAAVILDDGALKLLCEMASLLGVWSINALIQGAHISRVLSALDGRDRVSEEDVATTARLVVAPRATRYPDAPADTPPPESATSEQQPEETSETKDDAGNIHDTVIAASRAALPAHLLELLLSGDHRKASKSRSGKSGAKTKSPRRGRPVGVKSGLLGEGARLNIVETLRAAAPWQSLRRREMADQNGAASLNRITIKAGDFRLWRLKAHGETVTVFVVDASGSTAVQRLGEAKGAVELLLSECYIRRDHAALIAFSGRGSELLLPPTRSLTRAKRNLADLPGGGGTPLASGIDAAVALCDAVKRKGQMPSVVLLTDGRANLNRHGKPGRGRAHDDAVLAAEMLRDMGVPSLVIDTSAKPNAPAERLADAMGARYLPLPHANADTLSKAVKAEVSRSAAP
ncbi:MAG: magnesium chelatase subunit D [Proteobacteria bacterium]|nr:magnesium chelatase subunit D [Pseudomonadota bacterium]